MNSLKGIDISSYQTGINLAAVPADFVIVKATEGTQYVNPDWERQAQQTLDTGKLLGLYHYSDGGDVVSEASHFLKTVRKFVGKAILFLDWESTGNPSFSVNDYNWMNHWLTHVKSETKTVPMAYFSASVLNFAKVQQLGFDFWIAQYANMNESGYQETPWNEGAYDCKIRQYTSAGKLPGYQAQLDLNKFYGSRDDWKAYYESSKVVDSAGSSTSANNNSTISGTTLQLLVRTMKGEYGNGDDRKKKLGNRYTEVQSVIDHISTASTDVLVSETKAGKYGNGDDRKVALGSRYQAVQNKINSEASSPIHYQIQSGDTLSAIAKKFGTTVDALASLNGITNQNYILAGQKIRVR